jgi:hypothetical protein
MGKKGGKSKGAVSQGIHSNVSKNILRQLRRDYMQSGERLLNQRIAFNKGKNVVLTIPNPNPNETNKRFIRVNARDVWKREKN